MIERIKELCEMKGTNLSQLEKTLGFANGSLAKSDGKIQSVRLKAIADYFGVTMEYLITGETGQYYLSKETAEAAQEMFENKELRVLFDVQKDMDAEDLKAMYNMALALKRKERGTNED